MTVKRRDSSRRDGGKRRLDRACGLDKQVAGEMAHSRSNLEVKLSGLPEALDVGLGERETSRCMKPSVRPDLPHWWTLLSLLRTIGRTAVGGGGKTKFQGNTNNVFLDFLGLKCLQHPREAARSGVGFRSAELGRTRPSL